MPFIPNELDAFHADQAEPDAGDFDVLRDGSKATGVVQGCLCSAQGSPDMTVAVAAGVIAVAGAKVNVAAGNVTITTAHGTNPRIDLVVVSSAGAKSVTAGTAVAQPVFPAIPANSVVLAAVYVPAADTTIAANQIIDKRVFVVPPNPTPNYDLAKARSIPRVKERSETVTLATGRNLIHGSAMAHNRLYFTTRTAPAYFIRCNNPDDLTDRDDFQFATGGLHDNANSMVYVAETDRIYVLFNHATNVPISEVHPFTHAVTDVINDTGNAAGTAGGGPAICSDGTNLYVATATSPAKVLKYRLSDFSLQGTATLTGLNNAHACLYDGTDVFALSSTGNWIARVNPSDMTFVSATFTGTWTDDMVSAGDYLWIGGEVASVMNLYRVEKANLGTQQKIYTLPNVIYGLHYDGQYVWALGPFANSADLVRVDPVSLDVAVTSSGLGATGQGNEILSDGAGRLFITSFESPAKIRRLVDPVLVARRFGVVPQFPFGADTITPMGKKFFDSGSRTTSTTSEGTLTQITLNANTLDTDGMVMRVTMAGTFAATANTKRIAFRLNSSNYLFDSGLLPFNDARWKLVIDIIRTGSATQDWNAYFISDSSVLPTDVQLGSTTADLTTSLFPQSRGQTPTTAGEVVQEYFMVELMN